MKSAMKPERWELVSELYRGALEREKEQRSEYLATACAGDEELRREVESLLAQEGKGEGFLEEPAVEIAARIAQSNVDNQRGREILRPPERASSTEGQTPTEVIRRGT